MPAKRAREAASRGDAASNDDANLARAIAGARAASLARRETTWTDERCDGAAAPGARRTEINFPGSREEYEELLLTLGDGDAARRAANVEKKLRAREGEAGEDDADDAWTVAAVIVPENGRAGEEGGGEGAARYGRWVQSHDAESDAFYYFHSVTHETTWERPSGVEIVPDETAAAKMAAEAKAKEAKAKEARERAFAEARADADVTTDALDALKKHTSVDVARVKLPGLKSWYYEDDSGNWQGPFAATELMAWRAMLPMELRLFEHGDEEAETTLANVLGDAPLLAQCAALGVVLPPRSTAAHAQAALREAKGSAALPEDEAEEEPRARNDWERAVMEGLPPERAIMSGADPAEVARKVIEKRAADLEASYASTGVYNTMLHRITDASTIAKSTSVYSDIGLDNYVDTTTLDAALHEMKNRKHVKLTPKQIARLKERKRKLKDKFNNEWLRRDD